MSNAELSRVTAIISSTSSVGVALKDGTFPSAMHEKGTVESTFLRIGKEALGVCISLDYGQWHEGNFMGFAKPIDLSRVHFAEGVTWAGTQEGSELTRVAKHIKWWKVGMGLVGPDELEEIARQEQEAEQIYQTRIRTR
jgi:hypothetical protein